MANIFKILKFWDHWETEVGKLPSRFLKFFIAITTVTSAVELLEDKWNNEQRNFRIFVA